MSSSPNDLNLMQTLYILVGRFLFPRQQDWERRKNAKIFILTIAFALALGLALAMVIRMIYSHER
jgi:hypothetical protein